MPLPSDVPYLYARKIRGVINLCWEYSGPHVEYQTCGIAHLRLPTLDLTEPTLRDIDSAINFVQETKAKHPDGRIFIHCKGNSPVF